MECQFKLFEDSASHCAAQVGLELTAIFSSQPPKYWDHRGTPTHLVF